MCCTVAEYVTVFNGIMEADFIQCQPNVTKWKKITKEQTKSDATLLIATFLFLQLGKCVIVLSDDVVCIRYLTKNIICKAWITITTIPKSTLFKNRLPVSE